MEPAPHQHAEGESLPGGLLARVPRALHWPCALALLAGGAVYAFWPLATPLRPWHDIGFVYAAGRAWSHGFSPYDFERWRAEWSAVQPAFLPDDLRMPFMYPPHWAPVALALAALPWSAAVRVWDAVNLAAWVAVCALFLQLLSVRVPGALRRPGVWAFLGVAMFNPGLKYTFWASQLTLLPLLGVIGCFWAVHHRRAGWLALFGFLAALKPQLAFVPLVYLLLTGGHRGLIAAGLAVAAAWVAAMAPSGLSRFPADFARCSSLHMALPFNAPDEFYNLPALVATCENHLATLGPLLALAAAVGLAAIARRRPAWFPATLLGSPSGQVSLVLALAAALVPLHGYDMVIYTPLLIGAYELWRRWAGAALVGLILLAGRAAALSERFHLQHPIAPYLTLGVALAFLAAWTRAGARAPASSQAERSPA